MDNKERFINWAIAILAAIIFFAGVPGVIHLYKIGEPFLGFCSLISAVLGGCSCYALWRVTHKKEKENN